VGGDEQGGMRGGCGGEEAHKGAGLSVQLSRVRGGGERGTGFNRKKKKSTWESTRR
jgi:hypothetical protein